MCMMTIRKRFHLKSCLMTGSARYVVLQNQGMRMGNIDDGMKKIEEMLDKVIVAFQKQLDSLFEADVVDITADIQVMEQMMASQGLTDQKDF